MTDLGWTWIDGTEALIQWLDPLGEVRDDRPSGAALPYRMVHRIPGPSTVLVDTGLYSVHTFASTKPAAQEEAMATHDRILALSSLWAGQGRVVMHDGLVVYADNVGIQEFPHWEQWDAQNSIHRFVGTYRVDFRLVAA